MDYLIAKEPEKSDYLIEPEPETPAQPQGLVSKAKDTAVSFGIGANSLLQMAGDFYGLATGDMGNVVSQQARENIQYLQQRKSPELRQAEEARRKAIEADEDELGKALTYVRQTVTNPSLLSNALAEQVPNLVGTGGAGALVKAGAEKVLLKTAADQAAKRLAAKKAAQIGTGAAVGAGAAMQGTDVGADLYDEAVSALDKITDEQAMSIPEIASLVEEKGASLDEAKSAFALTLGREAFALATPISAASQMLPGGRTIERAFVGKQAGRRLAGAITGGLGEAASEAVEEGGSRVAANLLARQFEPDRPLAKGVGEAVGQAAVVGGIPGAAFGAASSRPTTQPAPEGQTTAGKTGEAPASAATKSALAGAPEVALESSEGLTPEQFYAAINIRQARLLGGEPDPEDIRIAGEVPLPKVQIDPEKANRAIEEAQSALQEWADSTANAPQNIRIIFDPELLHNGYGVQGYYSPDGSIFINSAFVAPENVGKIASHEWAHQTLATPEGQQAFAEFIQREIPQAELDALATRYGTQDRRVLLEEWIAENQEKAPGVIDRIVARIREWLAGVGIVDLSDAEVADIMLRTLRQQAENRIQPDTSMGDGGAVPVDPNAEAYNSFIGQRTEPKMSLQKLPTAGDVVDANGNLKYTVPQKTLDVSHYSNIGGLTEIDPAFYGTGRGKHYHRMMKGINKSFFFVGNSKPRGNENVSGKGMTRYRTSIDSSRIYNMDKDPLSLWFAANPEKSEGMLKELGYDGFLARTDDNRTFVALFYPTNLETGELSRTTKPEEEFQIDDAALAKATAKYEREQARRLRRALSGKFSLTEQPKRISGVMASPSITDINYDRAKRNLTSANQARFKSQISEYAPEAEIFDAVGDWVDGSENSVAAIFQDRKSSDELQRLAAQVGLAGDQKAVLWWRTEPEGPDAIHEMIWPKGVSMDEARQAMIDVGLENRTLIQTPEGVRGFVFDQGRRNINKIEALNEHETQPSLESSPAAGDFLGSWTSRAEGRRAYRRVLGSTPQAEASAGELRSGEVGGVGDGGQPETRFSLAQTKTPEFKAWFGDSQIVDRNGDPRVMYHGTFNRRNFTGQNEDFTVFRPKSQNKGQPGVVFASPNPQLASEFTGITPSYLEQFSGDELGEKRPGARVYPVYVKAENPFDYENPRHVQTVFGDEDYIELVPGSEEGGPYGSVDYDGVSISRAKVENGDWVDIEYLLSKIKDAGFDGAYVSERDSTGVRAKNIAVFDSDQLKSATGNVGAFGQRPVTAEEARRMGLTEEEAAKAQAEGDIRFSLTEQVAKGRDLVLAAEAQKLKRGETTAAKYARKVEERMPLRPFEAVPEPATDEDILRGLANRMAGDRLKRELRANPEDIEGQQVEARLDIPSYEDANVWTVTLHRPRERADSAGKVLAYTPTAILRDVTFTVNETAAMKVAAGARKSSFATMDGTYVPATARSAYEQAVEAKESGDWVEIGMNPIRHSYFYDKADQRPVVSAEEVIQVGGLVLGRGVQYGEKSDRKFSLAQTNTPEFKRWFGDSKVVDADGNPLVVYHGTGTRFSEFLPNSHFGTRHAAEQRASSIGLARKIETWEMPVYLSLKNPKFVADDVVGNNWAKIIEQAKLEGYDGLAYWNEQEDFGVDSEHPSYVAFYPEQVRVAPVGENGAQFRPQTKTPENPDIRYSLSEEPVENSNKNLVLTNDLPDDLQTLLRDYLETGTLPETFQLRVFPISSYPEIELDAKSGDRGETYALKMVGNSVPPVIVANGHLLDGKHRLFAARASGVSQVPAIDLTGMVSDEVIRYNSLGKLKFSLSEEPAKKPLGERALEDSKATKFKNQKGTAKYLGDLLKSEFPEGLDRMDPEVAEKLADLLDRELSLALTMPDNANAIGWYGREMEKVVEILRSPELNYELDNPVNRGVFNALLAITSNGQEVVDQFLKSAQLYEKWKKTGKIPSLGKWGGERNRAMAGQIKFLNQMLGLVGAEDTVGFLTSESSLREHLDNLYGMVAEARGLPEKATVAAKEDAIGKYLNAGMPTGELKDYNTVGAIVFGPKLGGGFFANLYGKFDRLTMDRWFMRTFHRLTGRLGFVDDRAIQGALDEARRDLGAVEYLVQTAAGAKKDAFDPVSKERLSDSDLLAYIKSEGKKAFKNYREINAGLKENPEDVSLLLQDTLRRTYNRIIKAESGLFDAPDNGSHRVFIRDVLNRVQQQRAQRGEKPIDTSDIQAILWYLEKDIWDKLKDKKEKTQDELDEQDEDDDDSAGRVSYSNGAVELYRRKTGKDYVFKSGNQPERAQVLASD